MSGTSFLLSPCFDSLLPVSRGDEIGAGLFLLIPPHCFLLGVHVCALTPTYMSIYTLPTHVKILLDYIEVMPDLCFKVNIMKRSVFSAHGLLHWEDAGSTQSNLM